MQVDLGVGSLRIVVLSQPDIQFTNTEDGVAIAYWEIGSGIPLVLTQPLSLSHAELEWMVPSMEALYLELAKYFRLIRFDPRGAGMSDEPPTEIRFSIAGFSRDINAVVNALDLDEFNLAGAISMGPIAIQYSADHPKRVSRLVLCDTGPALADLPLDKFVKALDAVVELGILPSFSELVPSITKEDQRGLEGLMGGSLFSRPLTKMASAGYLDVDADQVMGSVVAPTLVVRSRDSNWTDEEQTRRLVTGITGAQMRIVPGTLAPFFADIDSVVEAFVSFLTSDHHVPSAQSDDELRTVVFTDLVSSTEILSRLGDDEGRSAFRDVEALTSELCATHHGRLIKNTGDGSLISFKSTQRALRFALELQERIEASPFGMRIGMAAGEPIQEYDDLHGAVVVQASRIADLGHSGQIVVADTVRQLAMGKGFSFAHVGDVTLKGFDQPTSVWRVTGNSRP